MSDNIGYVVRNIEINGLFMKPFIHITVLFLLLVPGLTGYAQRASTADSLENSLKDTLHDTVRIKTLVELSQLYALSNFNKASTYALEAIKFAEKVEAPQFRYKSLQNYALINNLSGDFSTAIKYETEALQIAIAMTDTTSIGLAYSNIGNYYHEMGVYDEAYFYLTRSYRILQHGNMNGSDSLYMNIALHNLGRVFKEMGQYETALGHLRISYKMSQLLNDKAGYAYFLDEVGDVKLRNHQYDSAVYYLLKATAEAKKLLQAEPGNIVVEVLPKTLSKIALAYLHKQQYEAALAYYDSAMNIHQATGNQFGIADVELGRGMVFARQANFTEAERLMTKALGIGQSINARLLQIKCHDQLSALYEKRGEFEKALRHNRQHQQLRDSIFSQGMQQKFFRDQLRFETEEKDDQIASLMRIEQIRASEIRKQEIIRNILVVVVALTAILLVTVYRSGQRRKRINSLLLQHQEEMEKRSQELEQLNKVKDKFFSIISHDLRSPVNALAGLLDLLDKGAIKPEELPMALKELRTRFNHTRTLLNNLLDWTLLQMDKLNLQAAKISLHALVEENIALLTSLHQKNIKLINNVSPLAYALADSNTINLVIRNLLTNALKFTNDGGEIVIGAEEKNNEWIMFVRDNGVGMSAEVRNMLFDKINPYSTRGTANEKGTGLGLILCKEFVEKNNGRIWVESEEGKGSTFWFSLPKA
ncbi:MAG: tetratricopeptide repeat-containing sensor histidine kinase [Flammeovirgaceae bacterium]|nr:MAG: tetratricopeptide repeat-containing sensor histidine kinase [Flammeovirgaceae bacterium]